MTSHQIEIRSLLKNELEVQLPLHISLSRPLVLKSVDRDGFLAAIRAAIASSGARKCVLRPSALRWHPNETRTRWFLVLQLEDSLTDDLGELLRLCNEVARMSGQSELYADTQPSTRNPVREGNRSGAQISRSRFHISLAWSLTDPEAIPNSRRPGVQDEVPLPNRISGLRIPIGSVKVRLGQHVTTVTLAAARRDLLSP